MLKLALLVGTVTAVAVSFGVLTAGGVTSKPLVAVPVDEYSVFPGTQGAPKGKVRFVVTNIGTVEHEFVVLRTAKPAGNLLKGPLVACLDTGPTVTPTDDCKAANPGL